MHKCVNECSHVCRGGVAVKLQVDLEAGFWKRCQEVEFQVLENVGEKIGSN